MFFRRLAVVSLACASLSALDTKALLEQVRSAPTPAEAIAILTAALPQAETPQHLGFVQYNFARVYQSQGNPTAAVPWFEKALATHRSLGDRFQEAVILNNWAIAETDLGETVAAKDHFEAALAIRHEIKDGPGIAYTLLGIANVYAAWGDLSAALQTYETVAVQWRQLKNVTGEAHAVNNGGLILAALGDPARAAIAHKQAIALFRQAKEPRYEAYALSNLGLVEAAGAEANFRAAIALLPSAREKAYAQQNLADLLFRNGQNAEALQLYSTSLAAKNEAKDRAGAAYTHGRLAAYRLRQNQLVEAESEGRQAIDLHVAVGDRAGEASALATLAAIEWAATKRSQALATIARARGIIEETRSRVLSPELRTSYFATKRSIYDFEISKLLAMKRTQDALAVSERARARLLLDELDERETPVNSEERRLRRELSAQQKRLPGSRAQVETLLRAWRTAQAALRREFAAEPRSPTELLGLARPDTTLVQFWLAEEEGAAFVITPQGGSPLGDRPYKLDGDKLTCEGVKAKGADDSKTVYTILKLTADGRDEWRAFTRRHAAEVNAAGFALNVAHTEFTSDELRYADSLRRILGRGARYVVDTGRNGLGPTHDDQWCNPPGRKNGRPPTLEHRRSGLDAMLWIKKPGHSDGFCNGGPAAGVWWPEYARGLAL